MKILFGRFYIKNYHDSKRFTIGHFLAIWASKSTIHQTILRYEVGLGKKRRIWTGWKAKKLPPSVVKRLVKEDVKKKRVHKKNCIEEKKIEVICTDFFPILDHLQFFMDYDSYFPLKVTLLEKIFLFMSTVQRLFKASVSWNLS